MAAIGKKMKNQAGKEETLTSSARIPGGVRRPAAFHPRHRRKERPAAGRGERQRHAERQTAGRGRLGRTWHSPAGQNLYCSIVLRPPLAPAAVPQLGLVVGVAVADAVAEATGLRPAIKWPNDVLLGGRKVCGILTEMEAEVERVHHVIAGIGVNLNLEARAFPRELRRKATSLRIATGRRVDRAAFTGRVARGARSTLWSLPDRGIRRACGASGNHTRR